MRVEARLMAYIGMAAGAGGFLTGWHKHQWSIVTAAGAVCVASLGLLGVALGLTTWRDEKRRAREDKERDAYAALVLQLLSRFVRPGGYDPQAEAAARAQIAVWGDAAVVRALGDWHRTYDRHVPTGANGQLVALTTEAKSAFEAATGAVVSAVRLQLVPGDTASPDDLVRALFNQPPS